MYRITAILISILIVSCAFSQEILRPEHPMPQMQRAQWLNLNGPWDYAETNDRSDESFLTKDEYPETILVPFCRESKLSGIERTGFINNVWYRRTFEVPKNWNAGRIRLHFGACDWYTRVWVNGQLAGEHEGGFSAFVFDITDELQSGENTVIVHAYDNPRSRLQPLGKQSIREKSYGIFYTRTTGIWQTVWLEGVGGSFIRDFKLTNDVEQSRVLIQAEVDGPSKGLTIAATAKAEGKTVATAEVPASWRNGYLTLNLDVKKLWMPDDPFLYDLTLQLKDGGKVVDELNSYFGLREVNIEGGAILINGKPVFLRAVLDQGFYPDGVWTAPSDEALRGDIELSKSVGFNGARLHQKVFEPRFLYWADKLGYLVWGEYPSYGAGYENPAVNRPIIDEWVSLVRRDRNHPAILGWCPFNETPGEAGELQNTVVRVTRALDPSRPVIDTSGWAHSIPDPEVMDAHDYNQDPVSFKKRWEDFFENISIPKRYGIGASTGIPFYISEFGGIGWFERKEGQEAWGYGNNPKTLDEFYARFKGLVDAQLDNPNLFGYCYTQLTDIEQERNGIFYFDRTPKFDAEKLHAIQSRTAAYEKNPPLKPVVRSMDWTVLVGGASDGDKTTPWKYTETQPPNNWMENNFNDRDWKESYGGFGHKDGWEKFIRTEWTGSDIWLRKTFIYHGPVPIGRIMLVTHYDNATEIHLNGKLIWQGERWNDRYEGFDITESFKNAIQEERNILTVHCHQDEGGQFIDVAILVEL